ARGVHLSLAASALPAGPPRGIRRRRRQPASMTVSPSTSHRLRVLQCITRLGLGGAERVAFAIMRELKADVDFAVFTVHGASADAIGREMRRTLKDSNIPWFCGTSIPM